MFSEMMHSVADTLNQVSKSAVVAVGLHSKSLSD